MLPLLLLLFQEVAAPSTFAWSHQPVIRNSKIPFGWTSHFRIRQGLFSLSCTATQHFPSSYLQRPSSQLLRISAAQSAPACTSRSALPCHQLQPAQIAGLMYSTLLLALVLMEGTIANGKQVLTAWGGDVPLQKKKKKKKSSYMLDQSDMCRAGWRTETREPDVVPPAWLWCWVSLTGLKSPWMGGHLRWVSSPFLLAVLLQAKIVVASRSFTCLWASIFWKVTAVDVLRILLENPWEEKNRRHCLAVKLWLDCTQGEQVIGIQGLDYRSTKCLDCFLEW